MLWIAAGLFIAIAINSESKDQDGRVRTLLMAIVGFCCVVLAMKWGGW